MMMTMMVMLTDIFEQRIDRWFFMDTQREKMSQLRKSVVVSNNFAVVDRGS